MHKVTEGQLLWQPGEAFKQSANISAFMCWLRDNHQLDFNDYEALWRWSVADLAAFWQSAWDYFAVQSPQPYDCVLASKTMPGAQWFPGAKLNFAQHLLNAGITDKADKVAIYAESETRDAQQVSWRELRARVRILAGQLRALGVVPGDRVVAYLPNTPEAVIALLATASIGAVWSACSPDFGIKSVLDRFQQIEPKVLFAVDGYRYGGKVFKRREQVEQIIAGLPTLSTCVYLPYLEPQSRKCPLHAVLWPDLMNAPADAEFIFEQVAFDHPLWVVYSSGTTGLPKGIVHGHGGILLEQLKFQTFHNNLGPDSCKLFFTTTGWIMFNLVLSAMLTGSAIVLYDGNPAYPDLELLWRLAERYQVTYFGTSPTFVNTLMQHNIRPQEKYDLSRLQCIVCTGSPATPEIFSWFYANVKRDVWVAPLCGGTDVAAPFIGGLPILPVHAGEMQAPCLGVDVKVYDDAGKSVIGEPGELVITQPMPSMPLYLWNDADNKRYLESYFNVYPGVWRHGDLMRVSERLTYAVYGRSDSTLNRYGVRIGTSEIYRALDAMAEIEDSLIINLELSGGRFFMPLFVVLREDMVLDNGLCQAINQRLRNYCSPRHVPDRIYQIDAVPYTLTGKKQEVPVKRILLGEAFKKAVNPDAMANPASIDYFVKFAQDLREEITL